MSGLTTTSAPPRLLAIPARHRFTDNSWTSIAIPKPHLRAPRIICMEAPYLITKLESAEKTWKALSVVSICKEYEDCEKQLEESKALVDEDGNDEEMAAMISYEIESLSNQMIELEEKLKEICHSCIQHQTGEKRKKRIRGKNLRDILQNLQDLQNLQSVVQQCLQDQSMSTDVLMELTFKKPIEASAPKFVEYLMDWIEI